MSALSVQSTPRPPRREVLSDTDSECTEKTQGVERMSHVRTSRPVRVTALVAAVVVAIAAFAVAGCGGTIPNPGGPSGNGAPANIKTVPDSVRGQALDELHSLHFTFDAALVSVRYGNAQTRLIVTGPITGPAKFSAAGAAKKAPAIKFTEVDLSMQGGTWTVVRTMLK